MLYSFPRLRAVLGMRRQDYLGRGAARLSRAAHHRAATALDAYVEAGVLEGERGTVLEHGGGVATSTRRPRSPSQQAHRVRRLKDLHARTCYSHRGGYYTLDELAGFDEHGLWAFVGVRFSRAGTLVATAEAFVNDAEARHFVDELDSRLGVGTQDALRKLVGDRRLTRHRLADQFLRIRISSAPDDCRAT